MLRLSQRPTPPDLVVVAIDDRSLTALGRWPWSRVVHADLLRRLAEHAPKAILYDVLFVESQPGQDEGLAAAMSASSRVFAPLLLTVPGQDGAPYQVASPVRPVAAAAAAIGQVNVHPDADGIVRRAWLMESAGQAHFPHLVAQLHTALTGAPPPAAVAAPADSLRRGDEALIPYPGPSGRIRTVSAVDLLRGEVPGDFFKDKVVFVGATAMGLGDRFPTPVGDLSGVELQAGLLDGLLTRRIVAPAGTALIVLFSLLPLGCALTGFLFLRPRNNMLLAAGLYIMVLAISLLCLKGGRLWLPPGAALAGLALAYPAWGWRRLEASSAYMVEELQRLQLEPSLLAPEAAIRPAGDVVERQVQLMRQAVGRNRDLRRFVSDALQGLPDATLIVNAEGAVLMASGASARLWTALGLQPQDHIAPVLAILSAADPKGSAPAFAAQGGCEAIAPDGTVYHIDQSPILGHDGSGLGWIVRFGDITAIRAAQQQREEVLQLLTHDMRSPQASILALLDGLQPRKVTGEAIARIQAMARRTLGLSDSFVQLARAEAAPLDRQTLDISDVLVEAVDELWPLAHAKGVALEAEGVEAEHLVLADRTLVARALVNLIGNAVQHTPAGRRVACSVAATADAVSCIIDDEGPGLSPGQAEKLFERFGSSRAGQGGIGLGLALVRAVAQRHGGRIAVAHTASGGARFVLTLPKA